MLTKQTIRNCKELLRFLYFPSTSVGIGGSQLLVYPVCTVQLLRLTCTWEFETLQISTEKMPIVFRDGIVCSEFKNQPAVLLQCSTSTGINPRDF